MLLFCNHIHEEVFHLKNHVGSAVRADLRWSGYRDDDSDDISGQAGGDARGVYRTVRAGVCDLQHQVAVAGLGGRAISRLADELAGRDYYEGDGADSCERGGGRSDYWVDCRKVWEVEGDAVERPAKSAQPRRGHWPCHSNAHDGGGAEF